MKWFILALVLLLLYVFGSCIRIGDRPLVGIAQADHGERECGDDGSKACLQLFPTQLLVRSVWMQGAVPWCVDQRAANYPDFVAQLHQVNNQHAAAGGLGHRQVAGTYETDDAALAAGCFVRHSMPDDLQCGGCAGQVWYGNWPVRVEYRWQLGYKRWLSTASHELGHAECLEDEHYDKAAFRSWYLTYGYWQHGAPTVMDIT